METELIEYQKVTTIVENVEQAKAEVKQAFDLLLTAKARLQATLGHDSYYDTILPSRSYFSDSVLEDGAKESVKVITKNSWRYILAQTGLTHYMTEKRQKELHEQIEGDQLPPLTVENILGTFQNLAGKIDGLLQESIKEVFDWLRPRHNWGTGALKTNEKFKVGRKVIVTGVRRNYSGGFQIDYYHDGNFTALGNVFSLPDGKGVLKYPHDLRTRFNDAMKERAAGEVWEDDYFRCKCYGNGHLHIEFRRSDLVNKLNQIGGGDELPG